MLTLNGKPFVPPPEGAPIRTYKLVEVRICGVIYKVKCPLTRQPDKTWKASPEDEKEYQANLRQARREARFLLEPAEIAAIRKGCGYDSRRRFSEVVTGCQHAFQKYETDQENPSVAVANLLRILKAFPFVIQVLDPNWRPPA